MNFYGVLNLRIYRHDLPIWYPKCQNYRTYNTIQNTTGSFACQLGEVGPTNDVAIENAVLQMTAENPRINFQILLQML